jgi:hypothetical protein
VQKDDHLVDERSIAPETSATRITRFAGNLAPIQPFRL